MDSASANSAPPFSVKFSCVIFLVSSAVGEAIIISHGRSNHPFDVVIRVLIVSILVGLTLIPLWFAYRGKGWGRWFIATLQVLALFYFERGLRGAQARPHYEVWLYYANTIAQLIATVLLFVPSANRWFKLRRSMSRVPSKAMGTIDKQT